MDESGESMMAQAETVRTELEQGAETVTQAAKSRDAGSKPSLPPESYAGTYRDDW